jgi:hypothetical protein
MRIPVSPIHPTFLAVLLFWAAVSAQSGTGITATYSDIGVQRPRAETPGAQRFG